VIFALIIVLIGWPLRAYDLGDILDKCAVTKPDDRKIVRSEFVIHVQENQKNGGQRQGCPQNHRYPVELGFGAVQSQR